MSTTREGVTGRDGRRRYTVARARPAGRIAGLLLAFALLFSGDLVRIHGHSDGAPAAGDCAACLAGLGSAVEADPQPSLDPPAPTAWARFCPAPAAEPSLDFVRHGGLRDPPASLA